MKEPKRWECLNPACGFASSRCKSLKFQSVSFAICFKCKGRIKERQEWIDWLYEQRQHHIQQAIEHNDGYLFGVKVGEAKETKLCEKCGAKTHSKFIGKWLCPKHGLELLKERREHGHPKVK
jgi:hypothetical protein